MSDFFPVAVVEYWYLLPAFFCIAALYSSVGFGGGSSYLAILAVSGIEFRSLRAIALLCNIIVVASGTLIYWKAGHLRFGKTMTLIAASIPLAFLGGRCQLNERTFFLLLGVVLVTAAILLWWQSTREVTNDSESNLNDEPVEIDLSNSRATVTVASAVAGGSVGFLSGVVGIGGGIFLSPTLNLVKWDRAKAISATASLFILVNSIAGLAGQATMAKFELDLSLAMSLMISVFVGGQVGSRLGAKILPAHWIRRLTAVLVLIVGVRMFWR